MSFQSMMSSSQLCCLCIIFWLRGRPEWVTFWNYPAVRSTRAGGSAPGEVGAFALP